MIADKIQPFSADHLLRNQLGCIHHCLIRALSDLQDDMPDSTKQFIEDAFTHLKEAQVLACKLQEVQE